MLPFVTIFGKVLPMYGCLIILGLLASAAFILIRRKRLGLLTDDLIHIVLLGIVGAMIGAKVLYLATMLPLIINNFDKIIGDPALITAFLTQGYVFYGGLFGTLLAVRLYCRKFAVSFASASVLIAGAVPLFHVFGRIGCFYAGCCYGVEASWGVVFSQSLEAPNGVPLVPVQLFESGVNLLIFTAVTLFQRRSKRPERSLELYLLSYAACRFVLEFMRGDLIRGGFLGLSTSQWISAGILLFFAVRIPLRHFKKPRGTLLKEVKT